MKEFFSDIKDNFADKFDAAKSFFNFFKVLMFVFSVFSFVTYTIFTYLTFRNNAEHQIFRYLTLSALAIYFIFFVALALVTIISKNKARPRLKHYSMSLTVMRQILRIFNLMLSIIVIISASNAGFLNTAFQVFVLIISSFSIFLNLAVVVFRVHWAKKRKSKQLMRPRKDTGYADVAPILTGKDKK